MFSETFCDHGETHNACPICAKYKYYFESEEATPAPYVIISLFKFCY